MLNEFQNNTWCATYLKDEGRSKNVKELTGALLIDCKRLGRKTGSTIHKDPLPRCWKGQHKENNKINKNKRIRVVRPILSNCQVAVITLIVITTRNSQVLFPLCRSICSETNYV